MVDTLHPLIRFHKFRVDEKQREIGGVIAIIADLERQIRDLETQISNEKSIARASPQGAGFVYGNYAAQCILKKEQFATAISELEEKLKVAQRELGEEFRDLKGFEIIQEARDKLRISEQARADQLALNEIGLDLYRRHNFR